MLTSLQPTDPTPNLLDQTVSTPEETCDQICDLVLLPARGLHLALLRTDHRREVHQIGSQNSIGFDAAYGSEQQ